MPNFGSGNGAENAAFGGLQTFAPPVEDLVLDVLNRLNRVADKLDDVSVYSLGFPPEKIAGVKSLLDLASTLAGEGPMAAVTKVPETLAALYHGSVTFIGMADLITDSVVRLIMGRQDTPPGFLPTIMRGTDQALDDLGIVTPIIQHQGSTDLSDISDALLTLPEDVWNLEKGSNQLRYPFHYQQMWEYVHYAYDMLAWFLGTTGLQLPNVPDFRLVIGDGESLPNYYPAWGDTTHLIRPQPINLAAKPATQSLLDYLLETQPTFAWAYAGPDGANHEGDDTIWAVAVGEYNGYWRCLYSDSALARLGGPASSATPVWPGLDGVTLGEPVEFTTMVHLTGEIDGVILDIDSVPPTAAVYTMPSGNRYYHIGWVAFQSDNGQFEPIQMVEWPSGVYVPQSMAHAAGIDIWTKPNSHGIVTPWSLI